MYLQPISLESVFFDGLAAILNLTSRLGGGLEKSAHSKNGNSISIPINMQKLKECLFFWRTLHILTRSLGPKGGWKVYSRVFHDYRVKEKMFYKF